MGFYLLDIFIRRLLVRMRAGLFGAFLINYNFFFTRKLCSLGSFRTLCVHSRWSVLFASHLCVCLFSFYFHCFGTFIHFGFSLTSGVDFVLLSCYIFLISPIFKIRDEFFKNGRFVAVNRVRTTSRFLVTPISLLVGV